MIKEEGAIAVGTPPTNSVGTGAETSKRGKIYEAAVVYAFRVTIADLGDVVVYAKTETQVRNKLREYIRNSGQIINIQRVFATDVIDFYTQKRAKAMKRLPDVVLEQMDKPVEANPQDEKQQLAKNQQTAKQDAAKRVQLQKQQAQKQLQQKKIEMQKNLANQQKTLQAKAKSGSLNNTQAV